MKKIFFFLFFLWLSIVFSYFLFFRSHFRFVSCLFDYVLQFNFASSKREMKRLEWLPNDSNWYISRNIFFSLSLSLFAVQRFFFSAVALALCVVCTFAGEIVSCTSRFIRFVRCLIPFLWIRCEWVCVWVSTVYDVDCRFLRMKSGRWSGTLEWKKRNRIGRMKEMRSIRLNKASASCVNIHWL